MNELYYEDADDNDDSRDMLYINGYLSRYNERERSGRSANDDSFS